MAKKLRKPRLKSFRRRTPPGAAPGTIIVDPKAGPTQIRVIAYDDEKLIDRNHVPVDELPALLGQWKVAWFDVAGLGDDKMMRRLADVFQIHPLALEDVVHVHQRPKVEEYSNHYFIVMRMLELGERLATEQFCLFLGSNYVLTFQERPGDCFDPVRERMRQDARRVRLLRTDYLAYALIDAVVDHYFPVLEDLGDRLENLEGTVLLEPHPATLQRIHRVKQDLLTLRRTAWPLRDALHQLQSADTPLIQRDTQVYLRDCYDHAVQIIDLLTNYRETASGLTDIYISQASNRLNEVMRVLTVIATVFLPLSFMAGVWGMNFDTDVSRWNMPELEWRFGYPLALLLMGLVGGLQLGYFWHKGWLWVEKVPRSTPDTGEPPQRNGNPNPPGKG